MEHGEDKSMKCSKCGNVPQESDQFAWRCNSCKKAYKVSLKNMQDLVERKQSGITKSLLKCKECGNPLDDGNETIAWKCSCGNVEARNLKSFFPNYGAVTEEIIISSNLVKCPDCGKEISRKAKSCPNCGCPINQKNISKIFKQGALENVIFLCGAIIILCVIIVNVIFIKISNKDKMTECYNQAFELYKNDELAEAKKLLGDIPDYKGVNELIIKIEERENEIRAEQYVESYYIAIDLYQKGNFTQAKEIFNNLPEGLEVENEIVDIESILEKIDIYKQCVTQIKKFSTTLKDPDSLEIKEVYYSVASGELDKDVVYITYKATNSFGAYIENTACIQDGIYMGEQYKDIDLSNALLAYDQRQKLDAVIVQNGLNNY